MKTNPKPFPKKLKYSFDGTEGDWMEDEMTARIWRSNYESYERKYGSNKNLIRAHFYGRELINELLETKDAVGIRIYYGLNDDGEKELLLYAVDKNGKDIVQKISPQVNILDFGWRCPPYC